MVKSDDLLISLRKKTFWKKVEVRGPDDCWLWFGNVQRTGYGLSGYVRRIHNAHKVAWIITNGEVPSGLCVCHRCDVRLCCNPAHLFLGTQQQNIDDMIAKGRANFKKGQDHASAILTDEDVLAIRKDFLEGMRNGQVATKYGISRTHVGQIVYGKSWPHIKVGISVKPNPFEPNNRYRRLTEIETGQIKSLFASGLTQTAIAKQFNVTAGAISRLVRR